MRKEVRQNEVNTERECIQFISNDGMVFNDEMECSDYENSAIGKIMEKIHGIAVSTAQQSEVLINSSDDYQSFILNNDEQSRQLILQLQSIFSMRTNVMEIINGIPTDEHLILNVSESRDWMWVSKVSLEGLINNLRDQQNLVNLTSK